jgi:hypothetical protein
VIFQVIWKASKNRLSLHATRLSRDDGFRQELPKIPG